MKLPAAQKKLQDELGRARADIEDKLVPKTDKITRHLTLPAQGRSAEWIIEEMVRMDKELGAHTDWRQGKISGAVYRTCSFTCVSRVGHRLCDTSDSLREGRRGRGSLQGARSRI